MHILLQFLLSQTLSSVEQVLPIQFRSTEKGFIFDDYAIVLGFRYAEVIIVTKSDLSKLCLSFFKQH
jgi:hypothetical protein